MILTHSQLTDVEEVEPMTDEELRCIKEMAAGFRYNEAQCATAGIEVRQDMFSVATVEALLAEVERLRAQNADLYGFVASIAARGSREVPGRPSMEQCSECGAIGTKPLRHRSACFADMAATLRDAFTP